MAMLLLALAATLPAPTLSDGDAIVAVAWERRRKDSNDPAVACVSADPQTMADQIRAPGLFLRDLIAADDADKRPDPARLRRVAKGEGETLAFDPRRLGLPAPTPACKFRYFVTAPVRIADYAYVQVGLNCEGLCGYGEVLMLERKNGAWRVAQQILEWVS